MVVGVLAGSARGALRPAPLFKAVFVLVAGVSALRLLFGRDSWKLGADLPGGPVMQAYGFSSACCGR